MNFLLVNDDGIQSEGIFELAAALSKQGTLFLCAPDRQQSGKSHSITLMDTVEITEADFPGAAHAWHVDGTPADCTKLGLQKAKEFGVDIDIVFSGINKGCNLGRDTLYSGTVGAAIEGALQGIRAIAVSVNDHNAYHFETACHLAVQCIPKIMEMKPGAVININTPNLPREEIKGIKTTSLGPNYFVDGFVLKYGNKYLLEGSIPDFSYLEDSVDVGANYMGYATITPLQFDFTAWNEMDRVSNWDLKLD